MNENILCRFLISYRGYGTATLKSGDLQSFQITRTNHHIFIEAIGIDPHV